MASLAAVSVVVLLLFTPIHTYEVALRRQKRIWIRPPPKLYENQDYTKREFIATIRSDQETRTTIIYSLEGKGANEEPINLFTVNPRNGYVRINGILDREETSSYSLMGIARFHNGSRAEKDVPLVIMVLDENDCSPVFSVETFGSVSEASAVGTYVMKINATDADQPDTPNSQISYFIEEQSPAGSAMFYIKQETGEIYVMQNRLDRETQDTYTLTVKGTNVNGKPKVLSGLGQVVIRIQDVNDNIPTLDKDHYEGSVYENTYNMEVMRIKAMDADLIYTDNWLAVFSIVSGNEAGYFSLITDNTTNEGILILNKPLDYEELKEVNLHVTVSNKAVYHSSVVNKVAKTYNVKIHVKNEPEGPRFQPPVKVVSVSENIMNFVTTYTAIDSDTLQIATNVRYAKGYDIDNWLTINEKTAEIRLNKMPDRESKYLTNGTYYAQIICITNDLPAKTATGTIAIQVEDYNDHCPTLTRPAQTVCYGDSAVYVTAVDEDAFPNGAPFEFRVDTTSTKEKWTIERLNATTAILRTQRALWPGRYSVAMVIRDQQGEACADNQVLQLEVCTCDEAKTCLQRERRTSDIRLGAAGVFMILLGFLLLLLLPLLLLFCLCAGAGALPGHIVMPYEPTENLIAYHTEGLGEDKDVPLLQMPGDVGGIVTNAVNVGGIGGMGGAQGIGTSSQYHEEHRKFISDFQQHHNGHVEMDFGHAMKGMDYFHSRYQGMSDYEGIALPEEFLGEYYTQKASCSEALHRPKDVLLTFDYEGHESPAGSVGCCSLLEEDDDLNFLNDLGPKFKTLAEICRGSAFEPEPIVPKKMVPKPPTSQAVKIADVMGAGAHTTSTAESSSATSSITSSVRASTLVQKNVTTDTHPIGTTQYVSENIVVPTQTLLIQQPALYYTAAPPVYVVEPRAQPTLLVSGVSAGENLVLMERAVPSVRPVQQLGLSPGLVRLENQQGAQNLLLLEGRTEAGEMTHGTGDSVGQSQVIVMEKKTAGGKMSGSGRALVLGNGRGQHGARAGLTQSIRGHGMEVAGPGMEIRTPSFGVLSGQQGLQNIIVEERVSVTERNVQSSSNA
ncbi:desmoglein-2-like [Denticeps clupeoides]|uniref:Cadherin domain-containing protein n=1 Tax=Denticeps clupeoides TaxID=299321 RepID=A0AAY4CYL3_9TELE|nr:desmoglein-2-like [Denticeps clupeoides]